MCLALLAAKSQHLQSFRGEAQEYSKTDSKGINHGIVDCEKGSGINGISNCLNNEWYNLV